MPIRTPITIVDIADERGALADAALALIEHTFDRRDRQPLDEVRSEIAETRLDLPTTQEYHMLAAIHEGAVVGTITGSYLAGVNAGFVTYLAVTEAFRRSGTGRKLRSTMVERFAEAARERRGEELAWVLGEVRIASPWLKRLVRNRGAVPFDLAYYHPGVQPPDVPIHALYRQPVGDHRIDLPAQLVRRIIYAIYRRGFRVRYPLLHTGFVAMLDQLEGRESVGMHPKFAALASG